VGSRAEWSGTVALLASGRIIKLGEFHRNFKGGIYDLPKIGTILLASARVHLAEMERKVADLKALRRELADLLGQCRHGTVAECRVIEALSPSPTGAP
jgi:hypothetical protein